MTLDWFRLSLVFALLACCSLHAKEVTSAWFADGKFIEESESQRMTNGIGGRLDFTEDPDFLKNWRTHWNSVSSVKRLESVYIVLFIVCNYDQEQHIAYDLTIKGPTGSVCVSFTNLAAAKQNAVPTTSTHVAEPTIRLGPRFTIFTTDPPDPAGIYTVEVVLHDRLRKTNLKLTKRLNVIK